MKRLVFALAIYVLLLLVSCSNNINDDINSGINFQDITETTSLSLNDIGSDFSAIRLETGPDILTDARTHFTIGHKYIICRTKDKLMQFDRKGNYIRTLAYSGSGPNEYFSILAGYFNESESHFYFYNFRDAYIRVIDLEKGVIEASIDLAYGKVAETFYLVNDNTLAIIPTKRKASDYMLYYQDMNSVLLDGVAFRREKNLIPIDDIYPPIKSGNGFLFFGASIRGDTIYRVEGSIADKLFYLNAGPNINRGHSFDGYITNILMSTDKHFVFKTISVSIKTEGGWDIYDQFAEKYFLSDKDGGNPMKITSFLNNFSDEEFKEDGLEKQFENLSINSSFGLIGLKIEALDIVKLYNSGGKIKGVEDLDLEGMLEADNPVLLIGKLR